VEGADASIAGRGNPSVSLSPRREERSPLADAPFPNGTELERKRPISGQSARCVRLIISAIRYRSRAYANKPRAAGVKSSGVIVRYAAEAAFHGRTGSAADIFRASSRAGTSPPPPPTAELAGLSEVTVTGQACCAIRRD